jgi:hypothetical protein
MQTFLQVLWVSLGVGAAIALELVLFRMNRSSKRISRSIDPINQKVKGLKLEVSALQRSRLERRRRLETDKPSKSQK